MDRTDPALLARYIELFKIDTFIIAHGRNDYGSAATTPDIYETRIRDLIAMLKTAHATAKANDPTIGEARFLLLPHYTSEDVGDTTRLESFAEVSLGLDREQARNEARRCLRCDVKEV